MTPGARRVLQDMIEDDECDLVVSGRLSYCGYRATTRRVVNELLGFMAISVSWQETESSIYYCVNDTGRAIIRRPDLANEVKAAVLGGKGAFTIKNDKIVYL